MTPKPICDQLKQLEEIVAEHPVRVPTEVVANFLHIDKVTLRQMARTGGLPFAMVYQTPEGRLGLRIPTMTFYLWVTQGKTVRKEAG